MIRNAGQIYDDEFDEMASAEFNSLCKIFKAAKVNTLKRKATENLLEKNQREPRKQREFRQHNTAAKINRALFISCKSNQSRQASSTITKIPLRTLFRWRNMKIEKQHKFKGNKTKLKALEDNIFKWFLMKEQKAQY